MRNTDRDWQIIGETHPYFGVITNEKFLAHNLTDSGREEFFATGAQQISAIVQQIRSRLRADFAPRRALDFGCGVGRLTLAMAAHVGHVIGIDIAPAMLNEADSNKRSRNLINVEFRSDLPTESVDWINSLICFQHIPPRRGYALLDQLLSLLAPGGVVSLHFTAFRETLRTGEIERDVAFCRYDGEQMTLLREASATQTMGHMSMYDYDMGRVLASMVAYGVPSVILDHANHGGHHGYVVLGLRNG